MKNNKYVKTLTQTEVDYLKNFSDQHTYNTQTQVIYYGQVPMAAYLLLEGKITLLDAQKRPIKECSKNSLLGFYEIYTDTPFKYTAEITADSKVLILDRSTILEIKDEDIDQNFEINNMLAVNSK